MNNSVAVNWTAIGVIIAGVGMIITVLSMVLARGSRIAKIESDIEYIRRDLNQLLALYRLVPTEEQDRRRRER